jgi:hypothetical protein
MTPARRAAWEAYLAITGELLPAISDEYSHGPAMGARLDDLVVEMTRHAWLWGSQGRMMIAAARSAVRIFRNGDREELIALLRSMAHRLYLLSIAPGHEQRPR